VKLYTPPQSLDSEQQREQAVNFRMSWALPKPQQFSRRGKCVPVFRRTIPQQL